MNALLSNNPSPIKYASPVSDNILEVDKTIQSLQLEINKEKSKVIKAEHLFENESPGMVVKRKDKEGM
jgi:hypothetical protein